ncbi:hypothetical protein N7517_003976 [Penicillium concentricum]|uniref:S-adenosyl-L-methionine-dependent methyltransferase n=1 Tax=Penicillium concentricum TaxID=293559 RepID=A0A9W9S5Z4_9EURO|nr:uncharacterized protein N7517_003976 [Penicillium concentricum]KAJ5371970.1 hypothetical protein N7517_003976 [Penicillium concentricum]
MALLKRSFERALSGTERSDSSLLKESGSPSGARLLNRNEVPSWYAHNPYIRTGYRPVVPSTSRCISSLLYLHSETVNVYSHLIPATIALLGNGLLCVYFSTSFPGATWTDQLVFHIYLTTSAICFGISSAYHTFLCHSAHFTDLWGRLDYVAIVFQILGSFISGIYIGFYCEPHLQKLYWSMIGSLGFLTGFVVVHPKLQSQKWRLLRSSSFVATGLSAFAPIIHAASIFPYGQLDQQAGLRYYYLEGLVIVIGVLFYASLGNPGLLTFGDHLIRYSTSQWWWVRLFICMEFWLLSSGIMRISDDVDFYTLTQDWEPQDFQSETTSIASSIAKGRLENGRRSPSDDQQFEAFEIGHMVFLVLDNGRENPLHHAPLGKSPKHILDIGTGKGTWAIDMADRYSSGTPSLSFPSSYCVSLTDFSNCPWRRHLPPPVTWMPPNCLLEVDDILRDWTWREPFDFIHMRLMLGAFTPDGWDQLYKQCYDALTPGGWIEQIELDVRVYSDDDTLKENGTLATWGDNFIGCSERAGRSLLTQETMRGAIEKAGFVDVHEKLYKIPLGPWPKDKVLKEAGQLQYAHWLAALEGWAMWLLTKYGAPTPWTPEEVQVYLSKVRAELRNPRTHAYELGRRVWARKPTVEEQMANLVIKSESPQVSLTPAMIS